MPRFCFNVCILVKAPTWNSHCHYSVHTLWMDLTCRRELQQQASKSNSRPVQDAAAGAGVIGGSHALPRKKSGTGPAKNAPRDRRGAWLDAFHLHLTEPSRTI